jgi:hypothetical protein
LAPKPLQNPAKPNVFPIGTFPNRTPNSVPSARPVAFQQVRHFRRASEVLRQACLVADRAEFFRLQVAEEGQSVSGSAGQISAHPLIAAENAARKTLTTLLTKLGVFAEEKRDCPGRPPKTGGW